MDNSPSLLDYSRRNILAGMLSANLNHEDTMIEAELTVTSPVAKPQYLWKNCRSTYQSWTSMKQRCLNKNYDAYYRYGGRGIKIHPTWINSFETFMKDMGERPSLSLTLERIENNGDYEPGNCKWATKREQEWNKRQNVNLTIRGETKCITAWALISNVPRATISYRVRAGWPVEKAVFGRIKGK